MKNPIVAAALSFIIPGVGQIYNGQIGKGLALIGLMVLSGILTIVVIGFFLMPLIWLYSMFDAYKTAEGINTGSVTV